MGPHQSDTVDFRREIHRGNPPNILFINNSLPVPLTSTQPSVPTSGKLVNTLETHKETPDEYNDILKGSDDLINSAFQYEKSRNFVREVYNKTSDDEGTVAPVDKKKDRIETVNNISWNNMFDTEFIPEINTNAISLLKTLENDNENEKQFKFSIPNPTKTNSDLSENSNMIAKKETISSKKVAKRKNQSKITDAIPKKVKKAEIEKSITLKNNFRKQKFTKTVKNWLNDVDPNNPVDEEILFPIVLNNQTEETNTELRRTKITIEKYLEDKPKKVVQSQLTNKGGVMKFGQPKEVKPNSDNKNDQLIVKENEGTQKSNAKEKKSKAKFVAPIKSQIPVKDVTYAINNVDEISIREYRKDLAEIKNNDIIVLLVYR